MSLKVVIVEDNPTTVLSLVKTIDWDVMKCEVAGTAGEAAAQALAAKLCDKGMNRVAVYDVSSTHKSQLISETFKYSHVVLASVTYNLGIYPAIHDYLMDLKALNVQNRTFALIENGSWAVKSGDLMQEFLDGQVKRMTVLTERLSMASALSADKAGELEALADAILESMQQKAQEAGK